MKKKFIFIPLIAASIFSLAACDKGSTIKYKDKEGNEQEIVVKPTNNADDTTKALYSISQAADSNNKIKEFTSFEIAIEEIIDYKLNDDEYIKESSKIFATIDKNEGMSAQASIVADLCFSPLTVMLGSPNAKFNGSANAYYNFSTAGNNLSPNNLYFDYNYTYKLGNTAEQNGLGKYYLTNNDLLGIFSSLFNYVKKYTPNLEIEDFSSMPLNAQSIPDIPSSEEDIKKTVEKFGITISSVADNQIEFSLFFDLEEDIKKLENELDYETYAEVLSLYQKMKFPIKLTIDTNSFSNAKIIIDFSNYLKTSFEKTYPNYKNTSVDAKVGIYLSYNTGTVKKITNTEDYNHLDINSFIESIMKLFK